MGFRCGFLGLLHMDVFKQRLESEFGTETVITTPTVVYKLIYADDTEKYVDNPNDFPELITQRTTANLGTKQCVQVQEPIAEATIVCPSRYFLSIISLLKEKRGEQKSVTNLDDERMMIVYTMPLNEIIQDLFDKLKSMTQGYAT
jgi:translation elongation factor EF-4